MSSATRPAEACQHDSLQGETIVGGQKPHHQRKESGSTEPGATYWATLPNELLSQIFSHLHNPASPATWLYDLPSSDIFTHTSPNDCHLKSVSLVCWQWRHVALPHLIKHIIWRPTAPSSDPVLPEDNASATSLHQFLASLESRDLSRYVEDFTILTGPDTSESFEDAVAMEVTDHNWIWNAIFTRINPLRLTINASPRHLAALISQPIRVKDLWAFKKPRHILSLSRKTRNDPDPIPQPFGANTADIANILERPSENNAKFTSSSSSSSSPSKTSTTGKLSCHLFTIRAWSAVLLNEGSFIPAYSTYEYFLRGPPTIIARLLGQGPGIKPFALLSPHTSDVSYVSAFPFQDHVVYNISHNSRHAPNIRRLYVQVLPRQRDLALGANPGDLWMEAEMVYQRLYARVLRLDGMRWPLLEEFEIGDTDGEGVLLESPESFLPVGEVKWERDGRSGRFRRLEEGRTSFAREAAGQAQDNGHQLH